MADREKQLRSARAERDRFRQERDDLRLIVGWIDPEYAATLRVLTHLAANELRRGDDLGVKIKANGSSSRAPSYSIWAYDLLRKQREIHREQSAYLRMRIRAKVDDGFAEEAPDDPGHSVPASSTPLSLRPSQNAFSSTPV